MSESRYYICDQRVSTFTLLHARLTEAQIMAHVMRALYHHAQSEGVIGPNRSYLLARRSEEYNEVFRLGVDVPEGVRAKWRQRGWTITPLPQQITLVDLLTLVDPLTPA